MSEVTFDPIAARRDEVAQYQRNIEMYKAIAAGLPSVWPDRLAHLKDAMDKHAAIAGVTDLDDVILVGDLWAHDQAQAAIRAETIEMRKSAAILAALESQA